MMSLVKRKFKFPQGFEKKLTERRVNEVYSGKMKFSEAEWYMNHLDGEESKTFQQGGKKVRKSNS